MGDIRLYKESYHWEHVFPSALTKQKPALYVTSKEDENNANFPLMMMSLGT